LYYTTDDGTDWYFFSTILPDNVEILGVASYPNSNYAIGCGKNGILLKADFQGEANQSVLTSTTTNNLNGISFSTSNIAYAVGDNGIIIKTIDNGDTWKDITPPLSSQTLNAVSFSSVNNGWAVGSNGTILHACTAKLEATPASQQTGNEQGDYVTFNIRTNAPKPEWTANASASWLTLLPDTANGILTVTANQANPTVMGRTATITVSEKRVENVILNITQKGADPALSVSPDTTKIIGAGDSINVKYRVNTTLTNWNAVSSEGWLSISKNISDHSITITSAQENLTENSRTATITVSGESVANVFLNVVQQGATPYSEAISVAGQKETAWNIYSNPTSDKLFIETNDDIQNTVISIYNTVGGLVYRNPHAFTGMSQEINISGFASGIYYIVIKNTDNQDIYRTKFLKARL
jgi:hypothetical protein